MEENKFERWLRIRNIAPDNVDAIIEAAEKEDKLNLTIRKIRPLLNTYYTAEVWYVDNDLNVRRLKYNNQGEWGDYTDVPYYFDDLDDCKSTILPKIISIICSKIRKRRKSKKKLV